MELYKIISRIKDLKTIFLLLQVSSFVSLLIPQIIHSQTSIACSVLVLSALTITNGGTATCNILSTLCNIYFFVTLVIGIIALAMFVLGGLLYGIAAFMPAAGNLRAGLQSWGIGIIIGGVIAVILYVLAPFIIGTIIDTSVANNGIIGLIISFLDSHVIGFDGQVIGICAVVTFTKGLP